jgi:hypothetical protein
MALPTLIFPSAGNEHRNEVSGTTKGHEGPTDLGRIEHSRINHSEADEKAEAKCLYERDLLKSNEFNGVTNRYSRHAREYICELKNKTPHTPHLLRR